MVCGFKVLNLFMRSAGGRGAEEIKFGVISKKTKFEAIGKNGEISVCGNAR